MERYALWTIAVLLVFVPLAFPTSSQVPFNEYKAFIFHGGAVTLALLMVIFTLIHRSSLSVEPNQYTSLRYWRASPERVFVLGLLLLVLSYVVSTLFSPSFRVSYFGFTENFSGNSLYDVLGFSVVGVSTAVLVRKHRNIHTLLTVLVFAGTVVSIYGLLQSFGWDAIGGRQDLNRPVSSFGNTLNFAGFLVISLPISLFIGGDQTRSRTWHLLLGSSLGIQLAALWLAGGRAAIISTSIALILIFILRSRWLARGTNSAIGVCLGIGIVFAFTIVFVSGSTDSTSSRLADTGGEFVELIFEGQLNSTSNVSARIDIWRAALSSAFAPSLPESTSTLPSSARLLVGSGPDLFPAVYPHSSDPQLGQNQEFHTHNLVLTVLTSTGLLGLISLSIAGIGLVAIAGNGKRIGVRLLLQQRGSSFSVLCFIVLSAKLVELQTSVPRTSDLVPTMAIIGLLVGTLFASSRRTRKKPISDNQFAYFNVVVAGVIALILLVSFIGYDLRRISVIPTLSSPDLRVSTSGRDLLERRAADMGSTILKMSQLNFRRSQQLFDDRNLDGSYNEAIIAWELMLVAEAINPFKFENKFALAKIAETQVDRGDQSFTREAIERYAELARNFPGSPSVIGTAATALAKMGEYDQALDLAELAIATEDDTKPWAKAWYAKGISEYRLGQEENGIESLIIATQKEPASFVSRLSHGVLSEIYSLRGNAELAEHHGIQAEP